MKNWLLRGLGGLFFGLGVIGIFLPVLPTTPFMLLALWAFSNSSQRWHDYIHNHPRFGRTAREWKEHRAISLRAKVTAVAIMALSSAYLIFASEASFYATTAAVAFMAFGAVYILTRPTLRSQNTALNPSMGTKNSA